jgi:uncharacterized membrane protein
VSRGARFLGHPIHQMLIVFPLGLLGASVFFDLIGLWQGGGWAAAASYMIPAGIVTGLIAAVFGLIDWLAVPTGTRARRVGLLHACGNVVVLALFAASWLVRRDAPATPPSGSIALSIAGLLLAGVTGWLGGELVDRLGVGVDIGANPDARSSLKGPVAL